MKNRKIFWSSTLIFVITLVIVLAFSSCARETSPASKPASPTKPVQASTTAPEAKVTGTVAYLEKIALPAGAIVEIRLLDISKQDAPAASIGEQVITTSGQQVPFAFEIKYNPATIDPRYTYAVRANIRVDGKLWFTTDTTYAVITQGKPSTVDMVLKRVTPPTPAFIFENTLWVLQSLGQSGNLKPLVKLNNAEVNALFDSAKGQVGGSGGVNRYTGNYELKGNKLSIPGPLAATAMAGPQPLMDQEREYLKLLQNASTYQITDGQLQIDCGEQVLIFVKREANELSVDISYSGKEVTLVAGGILTATLESNITTGYSWNENANIDDKTVLQQTDHKYQSPTTPMPGAGGKEIWNFKALKAGKSTMSMEYRRPFEPNAAPAKTFTLTVVVE